MKIESKHGSVLMAVTVFVAILAIGVASVMELSLSNNKLSQRNEYRARARTVAESELEYLYHSFSTKVQAGIGSAAIGSSLSDDGISDNTAIPTTRRDPFLQMQRLDNAGAGWRVYRSFVFDTTIGTIFGVIPGTKKTGQYSYYNAKIIVRPPATSPFASNDSTGADLYAAHPEADPMAVRVGRHMTTSITSIFQYNVFYQGDLEMAPGGDTVLDGDIASNGSAYLSATTGGSLTIKGQVRYLLSTPSDPTYFNKDSSNISIDFSHTLRKPGTYNPGSTLLDPTFPLFDASAHDYATSPANTQVETMTEKENLLGGADATTIAKNNPSLFGPTDTTANLAIALNNVYRSVLVPPPAASTAAEYPYASDLSSTVDDVSIAALRLYDRAANNNGLIITIGTSGSVESITQNGSVVTSGALWNALTASTGGVVTNQGTVFDAREGKAIAITQVDVGILNTALANYPSFNGILYVNLKNSTTSNPAAIRLVNGGTTPHPNFDPASSDPVKSDPASSSGFSVATNGGLYVKGNYNIAPIVNSAGTTSYVNPAMLMGDAVTVLSDNWNDANATQPLASRLASMTGSTNFNGGTLTRTMVVAAGILTGGVEATQYHPSGGAQNLVRYLEDWHQTVGTSDVQVQFYGALGSLFDSRYFTSFIDSNGGVGSVYSPPSTRTFSFNSGLKYRSPQGTPMITSFGRGNYFLWDSSGN